MPPKHWRCSRQVWTLVVLAVGVSPKSSNVARWSPDQNRKRSSHRSWIPFRLAQGKNHRSVLLGNLFISWEIGKLLMLGSLEKYQQVCVAFHWKTCGWVAVYISLSDVKLPEHFVFEESCKWSAKQKSRLSQVNFTKTVTLTCISWLQLLQKDVSKITSNPQRDFPTKRFELGTQSFERSRFPTLPDFILCNGPMASGSPELT